MVKVLAIFIGGGLGSILRYMVGILMLKNIHVNFPFATFLVNIVGSFILGFLYVLFVDKPEMSPALKLALTVGFCGGLTTFSTFSLEMFEMIKSAEYIQAVVYVLLSIIICVAVVSVGAYCAKLI